MTPDVYSANRPSTKSGDDGAFDRTHDRVMAFLDEKARRGLVRPFVRMQIINKDNTADQVLDFIRHWITVPGVDDVFIKNLDSMRPWLGNKIVSDDEDAIKARRMEDMPCQHIYAVGSMTVDGRFNACCHDALTELTTAQANIDEMTFARWWNGDYMRALRYEHEGGALRRLARNAVRRIRGLASIPRLVMLWPHGVEGAESTPFSLAFLVPQLAKVCDVHAIDCSLMNMPPESKMFEDVMLTITPDLVGISVWSQNVRVVNATIEEIRRLLPNAIVITGGPHVSTVNHAGAADYAISGEAEFAFPELIQSLSGDRSVLDSIIGVRYSGQAVVSKRAVIDDLDSIGMPNYDAMFLAQYQQRGYRYRNGERFQAPILATRGCPYECGFCEAPIISGRIIRKHSMPYLRELLKRLKYIYDAPRSTCCRAP